MAGREKVGFAYQESADESLDVYSALRKASEDSTTADQPMWGLTVWQVVGFFLLGLIAVCKYVVSFDSSLNNLLVGYTRTFH